MDTDQSSEWVGTTSSRSVEQPSPISGHEAKGGPILDTEQETVMNGALSVRTPTDMYEELEDVVWSLYQKPYTVRNKEGEALFTAAVDGLAKRRSAHFDQVTFEMKRANRYINEQFAAACKAQEACEMFGAVANLPLDRIKRLRSIGHQGK